jgi:hypothetical protein
VRGDAEDELLQLRLLVGRGDVCVQPLELDERGVPDVLVEDDGLLGGADHAVVERPGQYDVVDGAVQFEAVRDVVHSHRPPAGTSATASSAAFSADGAAIASRRLAPGAARS